MEKIKESDRWIYDMLVFMLRGKKENLEECARDVSDLTRKLNEAQREHEELTKTIQLCEQAIKDIESDNGASAADIIEFYFKNNG